MLSSKNKLIGRWQLLSCVASSQGETWLPFSENPFGVILYAPSYMMTFMSRPNRPTFSSSDFRQIPPIEIVNDFQNFECYCGTYSLDEEAKVVTHYVENSKVPSLIKSHLKRFYRFYDNDTQLQLDTVDPMQLDSKEWHFSLHWKKVCLGSDTGEINMND